MQTVEKITNIEFFEGRTGFITRIGTHMRDKEINHVISLLRRNADISSFKSSNFTGVDLEMALHCLNVDLKEKPVKQKLLQFGGQKI